MADPDMHQPEDAKYVERLRGLVLRGSAFDLREVVAGSGPEEEAALGVAFREYGRFRRQQGEVVEIEEFRLALPWLFESEALLEAAVESVLESALLLGRDHVSAGRALSRAHPLAAPAVRRALDRFSGSPPGDRSADPGLPRDFGPEGIEGKPRYRLLAKLGTGPNGTVYEALDREAYTSDSSPTVAVKLLRGRMDAPSMMERFGGGLQQLLRAGVASVAPLIDAGVAPSGEAYLVYRLIQGHRLRPGTRGGRAAVRDAVRRALDVARAVEPLHAMGVSHGWIKPTNVFVTPMGGSVLTDLGLARLSPDPLDSLGRYSEEAALAFVAPETLAEGSDATPAGDLYALGALLYWLLTGLLPNGDHAQQAHALLMDRIPVDRSFPPSVPADLRAVCLMALSSDPRSRPCSVTAWRHLLEGWLAGRAIPGVSSGWVAHRKRARAALPVVLAVGVGAGVAYWAAHARLGNRFETRAESIRAEHRVASAFAAAQLGAAEARAQESSAMARDALDRAERMEIRAEERIETARRTINEWKDSMIRSISNGSGNQTALLEMLSRSPLLDAGGTSDLLPVSARVARLNADQRTGDRTMESVVWQSLAGLKLYELRDPDCVIYLERARELILELRGANDPWAARMAELVTTARMWPVRRDDNPHSERP